MLNYCEEECVIITGSVLPVIINIFKISKNNQKNREKCLIIISLFLNELSYADGNDPELLSNSLDSNSLTILVLLTFLHFFDNYFFDIA